MTIIRINANSESIIDRLKQSAITMSFNVTNENESTTIIRIETLDDVKLDEWVLSESLENNPLVQRLGLTDVGEPYTNSNVDETAK